MDAWLVEEALRRIGPEHRVVLVETFYRGRPYAAVAAVGVTELGGGVDVQQAALPG